MGYETKMIIGRATEASPEYERDLTKPYDDGSGFEYKKDDKGQRVKTGRNTRYFMIYGELDLCKLGYQDDALNKLIAKSHEKGRKTVCYFYGTDGNTEYTEDRYGDTMRPVPIGKVIKAMEESYKPGEYRRIDWALALLKSMKTTQEGDRLQVIFWGH